MLYPEHNAKVGAGMREPGGDSAPLECLPLSRTPCCELIGLFVSCDACGDLLLAGWDKLLANV